MSLDAGRARLFTAFKTLRLKWDETKLSWHDNVRQDFEEQQLGPLEPRIAGFLTALDRLSQILHRVHQDCRE